MSVATARAATVDGSELATQAHNATTSAHPAAVADAPSLNPGAASSPSVDRAAPHSTTCKASGGGLQSASSAPSRDSDRAMPRASRR